MALAEGLQNALWALGGAPLEHRGRGAQAFAGLAGTPAGPAGLAASDLRAVAC